MMPNLYSGKFGKALGFYENLLTKGRLWIILGSTKLLGRCYVASALKTACEQDYAAVSGKGLSEFFLEECMIYRR